MKTKTVSGIILTVLLMSMLTLAFNIQPVEASGTIYITSDYTFTNNIYEPIVVLADNIVVDGNGYTLQGTGSGIGIDVRYRSGVTIKNMKIKAFYHCIFVSGSSNNIIQGNNITGSDGWGIWILDSNYNTIFGNNITANNWGIRLQRSSNNTVSENNITNNNSDGLMLDAYSSNNTISDNNITNNNYDGIYLYRVSNNIVYGNKIANNNWRGIRLHLSSGNAVSGNNITNNTLDGVLLVSSTNNKIYNNNFVDNTKQVESHYSTNVWDDGYPSGGNYWSDFMDVDFYSGPFQNISGSDGIWDHAYVIDANNQDSYPLVEPWSPIEVPPVEDVEAYIEYVNATIQNLPDEIFSKPEEDVPDVKNDFSELFNDTLENTNEGKYEAAVEKLNTIKGEIYEEIMESDERKEIISLIDNLIAYLETL